MTYEQAYEEVQNLLSDKKAYRKFRFARKEFDDGIKEIILQYTSFIPFDCSFITRLYYFFNKKTDLNRCVICNAPILRDTNSPYDYSVCLCGKKECLVEQRRQGVRNKFGVDNVMELKEFRDKISTSNTKTKEEQDKINNKRTNTCLERYGVTNGGATVLANQKKSIAYHNLTSEEVIQRKQKRQETCQERYGVSSVMQLDEFKEKSLNALRGHFENSSDFNRRNIFEYDGIFFDSSFELYYYIWATETGKNISRTDTAFEYFVDGTKHYYIPDFNVDGEYVEIKGRHLINENGDWTNPFTDNKDLLEVYKHKGICARQHGVVVISDISEQKEFVDNKYTKQFVPLFRKHLDFPYLNPDLKDLSDLGLIHHFHKSVYEANRKGFLSPVDAWKDKDLIKKSAVNRLQYVGSCTPQNVLQGFNVAKIAPKVSVFSPTLAKQLIEEYVEEPIIVDPFSGFSGRLLGALKCGKQYVGYDLNEKHVEESNEILTYLNKHESASVECKDLLTSEPTQLDSTALFTCPPYNDKEHWNTDDVNLSCDEWIDKCLEKYKCSTYLFVVDKTEKYKQFVVDTLKNRSHFNTNFEYVILIKQHDLVD